MLRMDSVSDKNKGIDNTLKNISSNKGVPKYFFILIVLLFVVVNLVTSRVAASQTFIVIHNNKIPLAFFTGVLSAFGNICVIFLVVFYWKVGYFTSLVLLILQFPLLLRGIIVHRSFNSIPGIFTNTVIIIAITLIFLNNRRIYKYQARLREQAITDSLTGLPNRFACTELINDIIKKQERFALVSVDLNNFKLINDTMGHTAGDKMLGEIANRWKSLADSHKTGTEDFIARLGGDEFALIIRGYNSCLEIIDTINAYEAELEKKITVQECDYFITARFGYAEFPIDADNCVFLFSCADAALHEIKRLESNNRIQRFSPDLLKTEQSMEIEHRLRTALDKKDLFYYLQPQFNMEHKLRGFEALARLKDDEGNFISPVDFIPIAEKSGLVDKIDLFVFRKAAGFLAEILKKQKSDIVISINVSVRHLMKNNFISEMKQVLSEYDVPASHFEIEITETIMIESYEKALQYLGELKELGFKIAIDDFGTGYSSLSYLHKFPANLLKIDKSFIDVMNTSESSKKYVASIISIGHILNFEVISEGVEDLEQLETLKSIGCDFMQGYIWGKPMPPEEAEKLV